VKKFNFTRPKEVKILKKQVKLNLTLNIESLKGTKIPKKIVFDTTNFAQNKTLQSVFSVGSISWPKDSEFKFINKTNYQYMILKNSRQK